jgi:hypothetical protein
MKVKCCWNGEHDSTMTEDRANPVIARRPGKGAESLAGWGIGRIAAEWKRGLKPREIGAVRGTLKRFFNRPGTKKIRARGADFSVAEK